MSEARPPTDLIQQLDAALAAIEAQRADFSPAFYGRVLADLRMRHAAFDEAVGRFEQAVRDEIESEAELQQLIEEEELERAEATRRRQRRAR